MADISDVSTVLLGVAGAALYPVPPTAADGIANSIAGIPARLYEGWPLPSQLDADLKGIDKDGIAYKVDGAGQPVPLMHVSVYPEATIAASASVAQVSEPAFVIEPAVHGVTATVSGDGQTVTLSGTPTATEYVSLNVDGRFIYSRLGTTTDVIIAALLADIVADFPAATASGHSLTIPNAIDITVRIGAAGLMGRILHRQRQRVKVSVWAPDHAVRTKAAEAIDVAMKQNMRLALPDTSQAILTYESTFLTDHWETVGVYRRDLIYSVEFATIEKFTAYEVTAFGRSAVNAQPFPNQPGNVQIEVIL